MARVAAHHATDPQGASAAAADLGLGHETTNPSQLIRWTVHEPAYPTPEDAAVGGPSSGTRKPEYRLGDP